MGYNWDNMKILLVEDDKEIAESLSDGLNDSGYQVLHRSNFIKGLEKASHELFDLIILDWMLPDGDGVELCRQLRQEGIETPILILTAKDLVGDKVAGLDAGADDYLTKPFELQELLARVRALVRRQPQLHTDEIEVGQLKINFSSRQIFRQDKELSLAPKEFELLEYLVRNKDRVLDKYQILDRVWLHGSEPNVNTVEVFIGYLRKKIDRDFPELPSLIHTVRGKGYLFGERK